VGNPEGLEGAVVHLESVLSHNPPRRQGSHTSRLALRARRIGPLSTNGSGLAQSPSAGSVVARQTARWEMGKEFERSAVLRTTAAAREASPEE
jgi:hypothetical protein